MPRDTIYSKPLSTVKEFVFDEQVVEVFDDMIHRSVPMYEEVQMATAALTAEIITPGTTVYDLGCSTGSTLIALCTLIKDPSIRFIGIDNSQAMIDRCAKRLQSCNFQDRVKLIHEDINDSPLPEAQVVILNYTLQFIPPTDRLALLKKIYKALPKSGAILFTEKLSHKDPTLSDVFTTLHLDFKKRNGYSHLEVAQKREALENVLVPLSLEENIELLSDSGFSSIELYLKFYTFGSLIAVKTE